MVRFLDILKHNEIIVAACIDGEEIYLGDYLRLAADDFLKIDSSLDESEDQLFVSDYRSIIQFEDGWWWPNDASLIFNNGDGDFSESNIVDRMKLLPAYEKMHAHLRACETGRLQLGEVDIRQAIPSHVVSAYFQGRFNELKRVAALRPISRNEQAEIQWNNRTLLLVERHGIHVDRKALESIIARKDFESFEKHERKYFVDMRDTQRDGYMFAKYSPLGSKTLRFRSVGGFNPMGIPHGLCRSVITSRFEGGSIVSCDFNAIDFRCIVRGTEDKTLIDMYGKAQDFHAVTARAIFGKLYDDPELKEQIRDVTKKLTYVHVYGGSPETIARAAQMRMENVNKLLADFDEKFSAITLFKERLCKQFKAERHITLPNGRFLRIDSDAHDGKIIGLYAQTFSSLVFSLAFCRTDELLRLSGFKSKIIFTVHDELVIDLHPNDEDRLQEIEDSMSSSSYGTFVVKINKGKNYSEATS